MSDEESGSTGSFSDSDYEAVPDSYDLEVEQDPDSEMDGWKCSVPFSDYRSKLYDFYENGDFSDITLSVEGVEFQCHKLILASHVPYFETMFLGGFKEENKENIELKGVTTIGFEAILDFAYQGEIHITWDKVVDIYKTAHYLDVQVIQDMCIDFMGDNPKGEYLLLANAYDLEWLRDRLRIFLRRDFHLFADGYSTITCLTKEELFLLLKSHDLNTKSEYQVIEALEKWFGENECSFEEKFQLLHLVRVRLFTSEEWEKLWQSELCEDKAVKQYFRKLLPEQFDLTSTDANCYSYFDRPRRDQNIMLIKKEEGLIDDGPRDNSVSEGKHRSISLEYWLHCGDKEKTAQLPFDDEIDKVCTMEVNGYLYILCVISEFQHYEESDEAESSQPRNKLIRYNPTKDAWIRLKSLSQRCTTLTTAATSSAIFVFGDYKNIVDNNDKQNIRFTAGEKYDAKSHRWSRPFEMNLPSSTRAAGLNDKVYLFYNKTIHEFHETSHECTALVKVEESPKRCLLLRGPDCLFVASNRAVERFDPTTNKIKTVVNGGEAKMKMVDGCCQVIEEYGEPPKVLGILLCKQGHAFKFEIYPETATEELGDNTNRDQNVNSLIKLDQDMNKYCAMGCYSPKK